MKLLALLVCCAGCLERVELANDHLPGLVALDVTPGDTSLAIALPAAAQTVAFSAIGHFTDGTQRDVTADVDWLVDDPVPGSFVTPGSFITTNLAAGHVAIHATHGTVTAAATLTIRISATLIDDGFPPPDGADALFTGITPLTDPMKSPVIAYPAAATEFPQALAPVLFQYKINPATDAYRLSFESDVLDLRIYTGSDRWRPEPDTWTLIAASHRDASVTWSVDAATSTAPGTVYGGTTEPLGFASGAAPGRIYYATKAKPAVFEGELANTSASHVYPYAADMTPATNEAVDLGGTTMAIAYGGKLHVIDLVQTADLATANPMWWAAVSPDGQAVAVTAMGMLWLIDATTGTGIGSPDGHVNLGGQQVTQPDWSPDGRNLALTFATGIMPDDLKGGAIARLPYLGNGTWGAPVVIVPSNDDNDNNYAAKWSPDGNSLAYVHTMGPVKDSPSSELRIVAATGGAPIVLQRASHQLAGMSAPMLADTTPAWSPDGNWLVFATARPYGVVRPMAGGAQLWITAIDLANSGPDPSAPAFWLGAQDLTTANLTPAWTVTPTVMSRTQ
jgi:hypothetical protein